MNRYLLDSSAVLALHKKESGADLVAEVLDEAAISSVNVAEVVGKLTLYNEDADEIAIVARYMMDNVIPFDQMLAIRAGEMIAETKAHGLSLGDRACLATAEKYGLTVITADKNWAKLKLKVKVRVIR